VKRAANDLLLRLTLASVFKGIIGGVRLQATIAPIDATGRSFSFEFEGPGTPATPPGPVDAQLSIGDDAGETAARVELQR
jgi:hypothetical protein